MVKTGFIQVRHIVVVFALLCYFALPAPAQAEIYKYKDENGQWYLTDKQQLDDSYEFISVFNEYKSRNALASAYQPEDYMVNVKNFLPHIESAAAKHDLDPKLIRAIIDTESAFDPKAYSKTGAVGLMQLMPKTAKSLGVKNSWNPKENIAAGSKLFRQLLDKFNQNIKLSLAAYNAGETAVRKAGNAIPDYPETIRYVQKVITRYSELKKQG